MILYYVSHPYGGKEENKIKVEAFIRAKAKSDPKNVYISPIHAFGYLYNYVEYWIGITMCLELLLRCDALILCPGWEQSAGCRAEKLYAEGHGIPIFYPSEGSMN